MISYETLAILISGVGALAAVLTLIISARTKHQLNDYITNQNNTNSKGSGNTAGGNQHVTTVTNKSSGNAAGRDQYVEK